MDMIHLIIYLLLLLSKNS